MTAENNGGKTGYYDLPLPDKTKIVELLLTPMNGTDEEVAAQVADSILGMVSNTLNDLIEFKQMQPWQHEVFKATYAIEDRATKNGGSRLREINKILYYAERGRQLELARLAAEGTTTSVKQVLDQKGVYTPTESIEGTTSDVEQETEQDFVSFFGLFPNREAVREWARKHAYPNGAKLTKQKLVIPTTHEPFFGNESQL